MGALLAATTMSAILFFNTSNAAYLVNKSSLLITIVERSDLNIARVHKLRLQHGPWCNSSSIAKLPRFGGKPNANC
ncbi:hypothetical protein N476_05000 [Pseudoalteromonas luteoviolacea H33]|uniref:Secreted protein n=1 Tax=Pseudoalteromonas luteoviolacea H33 TaxID=1365251 RepID=A0A167AH10_9GAMM|nr:hypothetical protein N476_05000 [Pseudoalteromonas luteoviolacea H33]KZN70760.1 hypothetical protein N477_05040 [Pseudoalteromonas luteoviolacea H33-S]